MKTVFFETTEDHKKFLSDVLKELSPDFHEDKVTKENAETIKDAEVISVFINSKVTKDIIDALPKLKLIATRSTGFDHIDTKYAKERGVSITTVPSYGARTVAEFTFGLMISLSRKMFGASRQLREVGYSTVPGETGNFDISKFRGFDLDSKTLGVIGTGRIGKNVVRIARAFNMKVLAHDITQDEKFAREMGFRYTSLEDLLSRSDIVTLHAPYNKSTHHMINNENISLMKNGTYLINTARGELIDTSALVKALKERKIAGAGLDVLEGERQLKEEVELLAEGGGQIENFRTLLENHVLIDLPQVIVTPHIAFFSKEAEEEILMTTAENIQKFIKGKPSNILQ